MNINEKLLLAVSKNDITEVDYLLKQGANIDFIGDKGYAAIHGASISGYDKILELLISHNANINLASKDGGYSALHFASQEGNFECVKILVTKKANVNQRDDWGNGPLFRAGKNSEIGNFLLNNGANPDMENDHGVSPSNSVANAFNYLKNKVQKEESLDKEKKIDLLEAVEKQDIAAIKNLIAEGADLEMKNEKGKSALFLAVEQENIPLIELLLKNNANINTQENFGYTPLSIMCIRGKLELVKLLILNGADTNIPLPFNNTLETLAKSKAEVLAYLKSLK